MTLSKSKFGAGALVISTILTFNSPTKADLIGPILPYFGLAQSPFNGLPFSYFHLETFEEPGAPTAPGMTASGGAVIGPGFQVDSVEGVNNGRSYFSNFGADGVTFAFNAASLGGNLPTDVGIVWTDGEGPNRTFKAFDASNALIGTIIDSSPLFFPPGDGDPANYRFFGVTDPAGISSIFIANDSGGIEVDDVQFGFLSPASVPEPSTFKLLALGILALLGYRWRGRYRMGKLSIAD